MTGGHDVESIVRQAVNAQRTAVDDAGAAHEWRLAHEIAAQRGVAFGQALRLARSSDSAERAVGADVLGLLGEESDRAEADVDVDAAVAELRRLVNEGGDPSVVHAAAAALRIVQHEDVLGVILELGSHPDASVRLQAALGIPAQPGADANVAAVDTLVRLCGDPDEDVRDLATCALATQLVTDSPAVRNALQARVRDDAYDTSCEAIVGLAVRGDTRALAPLLACIERGPLGLLVIEGAVALADPALYKPLHSLRERWAAGGIDVVVEPDVDAGLLDVALERCDPALRESFEAAETRILAVAAEMATAARSGSFPRTVLVLVADGTEITVPLWDLPNRAGLFSSLVEATSDGMKSRVAAAVKDLNDS